MNVNPPPGWPRPPAPSPRPAIPVSGWVVLATCVWCCGFTAFAAPLWGALTENENQVFRRRMLVTAGLVFAMTALSLILFGLAPEDDEGTPVGVFANLGAALLLSLWLGGIAMIIWLLVRTSQRNARSSLPGVSAEMERRRIRQEYRELAAEDPAMAVRIGVGRPDLARSFDDGGLLDLNNVGRDHLLRCLPSAEEAQRVAEARDLLGRFVSVEEVASYALLPDSTTERLREVAIFL